MLIDERVVLIKTPRTYRPGMSSQDGYEATRKWSRMQPQRHNPNYAFAVVGEVVRAVYQIGSWEKDVSGRWSFHGAPDSAMQEFARYVGADVRADLGRAQNPIRYINC